MAGRAEAILKGNPGKTYTVKDLIALLWPGEKVDRAKEVAVRLALKKEVFAPWRKNMPIEGKRGYQHGYCYVAPVSRIVWKTKPKAAA